jgi:uncharacterized membrane protein
LVPTVADATGPAVVAAGGAVVASTVVRPGALVDVGVAFEGAATVAGVRSGAFAKLVDVNAVIDAVKDDMHPTATKKMVLPNRRELNDTRVTIQS